MFSNDEGLALSYKLAEKSPDASNQNGAAVCQYSTVLSEGYNHFYGGVPPTQERPAKYERVTHAEADACLSLACCSVPVDFHTKMFCAWATCKACALAILGSRIPTLVIHYERCVVYQQTRPMADRTMVSLEDWQPAIDESEQWLRDGGVEIIVHRGPVESYVGNGILINGRRWSPQTLEFTDG